MEAPVVPMKFAMMLPMKRKAVFRSGVLRRRTSIWIPLAVTKRAPMSEMKLT